MAGQTLERTAQARVFRIRSTIYGCAFATGRRVRLGSRYHAGGTSSGGGGVTHLRLTGRFAALAEISFDGAGAQFASVSVFDLRHRRRVFFHGVGGESNASLDAAVTDLVVDRRGRVAWIQGFDGPARGEAPRRLAVRRHDRRGDATLDEGSAIEQESLTLAGGILRWRSEDGIRRSSLR